MEKGAGDVYKLFSGTQNKVMVPRGTALASNADLQVLDELAKIGSLQMCFRIIPSAFRKEGNTIWR